MVYLKGKWGVDEEHFLGCGGIKMFTLSTHQQFALHTWPNQTARERWMRKCTVCVLYHSVHILIQIVMCCRH